MREVVLMSGNGRIEFAGMDAIDRAVYDDAYPNHSVWIVEKTGECEYSYRFIERIRLPRRSRREGLPEQRLVML